MALVATGARAGAGRFARIDDDLLICAVDTRDPDKQT
jgi:hypothetical protein